MLTNQFNKFLALILLTISAIAVSSVLTDIEIDAEGQKVISLYGNYENPPNSGDWLTNYNDFALTIPDELICLFRQVWIPELLGLGDVRVEINDKICVGNEDGKSAINAVFNFSVDPLTGENIGKLWIDDSNSTEHNGKNVIGYMRLVLKESPSASRPYGVFTLDLVDEDVDDTQNPLFVAKVISDGTTFRIAGRITNSTFSGYSNSILNNGIYQSDADPLIKFGYNDEAICFQEEGLLEDCFPRRLSQSLTNLNVKVNVWDYGIYNSNGSRFEQDTTGRLLRFSENNNEMIYELDGGFGGHLRYFGDGPNGDFQYGSRPGGNTAFGSDKEFWTDKPMLLDNPNGEPIPVRLQWLMKTHSVHPDAAVRLNNGSIDTNGISLDSPRINLLDPNSVTSEDAKSIGPLPAEILSSPLKVKAGRVL